MDSALPPEITELPTVIAGFWNRTVKENFDKVDETTKLDIVRRRGGTLSIGAARAALSDTPPFTAPIPR